MEQAQYSFKPSDTAVMASKGFSDANCLAEALQSFEFGDDDTLV